MQIPPSFFKFSFPLITVLVLSLFACSDTQVKETAVASNQTQENDDLSNPVLDGSKQKTIMFFGDSITAGMGLDPSQAFPALIENMIDSLGLDYRVLNGGLSGETSAAGLRRIDWMLKDPVDVFVLELGANDGLRGIDLGSTQDNLEAILDKVIANNPETKLVVAGMMIPPNMGFDYTDEFRELFPNLAQKYDAVLIPFILKDVAGIEDLNQADGIHPAEEGHEIISRTVWEYIGPILD